MAVLTLAGLWGDAGAVHMALLGRRAGRARHRQPCPARVAVSVGRRLSMPRRSGSSARSRICSAMSRSARPTRGPGSIMDDGRSARRSAREARRPAAAAPYAFLAAEGEGLHQIPVGPVHAGIIEPGHFRFHAGGETIVRLEERLGYTPQGRRGADGRRVARPGAHAGGAGPPATARSPIRSPSPARSKARLGVEIPRRAHWLRALMAELERIANHLGDIGAICNDASFALMHAHTGVAARTCAARGCRPASAIG